jgi:type IV pilus assembly protein PilQ
MKPLFSKEYGLITTKRFIGGVGLSVMILAAYPATVFSLGEPDRQGKHQAAQHRDVVVKPVPYAVTDVQVRAEGDRVSVSVEGDGPLYPEARLLDESRLIVDIPGAIPVVGKWVVPGGHPLLKRVRIGQHTDKVRLVFDVLDRPQFSVSRKGADFVVTLKPKDAASSGQDNDPSVGSETGVGGDGSPAIWERTGVKRSDDVEGSVYFSRSPERVPALSQDMGKGRFRVRTVQMTSDDAATEKGGRIGDVEVGTTRFVGRRISMDFQQAEITNILRLIAEVSGFNIVVGEGVKGKVTMKLVGVPWDQALDMLLKMNGLGMIRQGTIVWIDTLANLSKQQDEEARSKEAKTKAEDLVNRLFYLRNVPAQEMMTALRPVLSPRGMIQFNQTTNALVVKDTGTKLQALEQLINGLDQEVPQVQIEARIVQADTVYARGMGIQWGIKDSQFTPTKFHLVGNVTGPFAAASGTGSSASTTGITRDFLVNLPAQVGGLPAVPSIGWTFGRLADGFALDMRLSAGELLGLTKVIASPKITTMDRREAKISQGESIPFQTTSLQGTQTTFVDANLELNVTPTIISRDPNEPARRIQLRVRATRNAVGARSNPAGPSIDRREATTQVNVRDGETMVIGGVFVDVQGNNIQGVPYLSRFPVLGWLFKNKSESVSKQELLIFLTPTIVKT